MFNLKTLSVWMSIRYKQEQNYSGAPAGHIFDIVAADVRLRGEENVYDKSSWSESDVISFSADI